MIGEGVVLCQNNGTLDDLNNLSIWLLHQYNKDIICVVEYSQQEEEVNKISTEVPTEEQKLYLGTIEHLGTVF
jgi:hypothetical protein